MKVLVINCSPVRNGATAEIVNIVISVSPSYWADIPGQFKVLLIDALRGVIHMNRMENFCFRRI